MAADPGREAGARQIAARHSAARSDVSRRAQIRRGWRSAHDRRALPDAARQAQRSPRHRRRAHPDVRQRAQRAARRHRPRAQRRRRHSLSLPGEGRAGPARVRGDDRLRVPAGSAGWMLPHQRVHRYGPAYEDFFQDVAVGKEAPHAGGWSFPALFKTPEGKWLLISESAIDGSYPGAHLAAGRAERRLSHRIPGSRRRTRRRRNPPVIHASVDAAMARGRHRRQCRETGRVRHRQ